MERQVMADILELLAGKEWLHRYPVTQLLTRGLLLEMPEDWRQVLAHADTHALNAIPQCQPQNHWPESLKTFLRRCHELSLHRLASMYSWPDDPLPTTHPSPLPSTQPPSVTSTQPSSVTPSTPPSSMPWTPSLPTTSPSLPHESPSYKPSCSPSMLSSVPHTSFSPSSMPTPSSELSMSLTEPLILPSSLPSIPPTMSTIPSIQLESVTPPTPPSPPPTPPAAPPTSPSPPPTPSVPPKYLKGLSEKKQHEVTHLVGLVHKICNVLPVSHVLDVGSGLGYVDSALHRALQVSVVGADSNARYVRDAGARQVQLAGHCHGVRHMHWTLADDAATQQRAQEILTNTKPLGVCTCHDNERECDGSGTKYEIKKEQDAKEREDNSLKCSFPSARKQMSTVVLGLHSCADLSPVMMKMFDSCPQVSALVLLPCCYHKMAPDATQNEKHTSESDLHESFCNFPMSSALKSLMSESSACVNVCGLRLAAQESGRRWLGQTQADHDLHMRNVAYRCLLEAYCHTEGLSLKKLKRRCARKSNLTDLDAYIETVSNTYEFIAKPQQGDKYEASSQIKPETCTNAKKARDIGSVDLTKLSDALHSCYGEHEHLFGLIEAYTGLQLAVQPVLEALVLADRVAWLREHGHAKVWLHALFDPVLSPRHVVLLALK